MDEKQWFGLVFLGVGALVLSFLITQPADQDLEGAMSPEQFAEHAGEAYEEPPPASEAGGRVGAPKTAPPKAAAPPSQAPRGSRTLARQEEEADRTERGGTGGASGGGGSGGAETTPRIVADGEGNTITGKVAWDGQPPKNPLIRMTSDKTCMQLNEGQRPRKWTTVVNEDGTLSNVLVHLSKGLPDQKWPVRGDEVTITQEGCRYHPHVVAFQLGQKVLIRNADPTTHNVHLKSRYNGDWNMTQSDQVTEPPKQPFRRPEVGSALLKCDIHTWMQAEVHILDHPFFAVTGDQGLFTIAGVPAGKYTLTALHEKWGEKSSEVEVTDDGTTKIDFEFSKSRGRRRR